MNLLAHAVFLPWGDTLRMTGAVIGDCIRGPLDSPENIHLPASLREGIRLHRALDTLSESHPEMLISRNLFPDSNRRFAAIAIDLMGDWVLWRHWREFTPEPNWDFVKRCERAMASHRAELPYAAADWANRILDGHLLTACTSPQGIRTASRRLAGRLTQPDGLQSACETALQKYATIEPHLLEFFRTAKQQFG